MKCYQGSNRFRSDTSNYTWICYRYFRFFVNFSFSRNFIFNFIIGKLNINKKTKKNFIDGEFEDIEENDDRENFKILGNYIKDMSSETKDTQTYLYVKDYISRYKLDINIVSKAIKNKMIGKYHFKI